MYGGAQLIVAAAVLISIVGVVWLLQDFSRARFREGSD
jgi:hypothetical protein